jgi:DNA-binding NarL/FixJ family response regulator
MSASSGFTITTMRGLRAATLRFPVVSHSVVLLDGYKITRERTMEILRPTEFCVIGVEADGSQAVTLCAGIHPEIVLTAIGLPGTNGIEVTRQILRQCPDTFIVMLTIYNDEDLVTSAINAGARAFMEKTTSPAELLHGLRTVISGGMYVARGILRLCGVALRMRQRRNGHSSSWRFSSS